MGATATRQAATTPPRAESVRAPRAYASGICSVPNRIEAQSTAATHSRGMPVPARSVYFNEDHALFRRTVRQYMGQEVAPHAEAWEAQRRIPREAWRKMADMGFLGTTFPEAYGGMGADVFFAVA